MDLLLILTYTALCVAIFKIFKIPLNKWTVPTAVLGGIVLIGTLLVLMNYNHPYTKFAREYFVSIPINPAVKGLVVEVNVKPNVPVKKGEVLFRIDPTPFIAVVKQKEAALEDALQAVPQLKPHGIVRLPAQRKQRLIVTEPNLPLSVMMKVAVKVVETRHFLKLS